MKVKNRQSEGLQSKDLFWRTGKEEDIAFREGRIGRPKSKDKEQYKT